MLKNFGIFFLVFILWGCGSIQNRGGSIDGNRRQETDSVFSTEQSGFKAAMLLPLTGSSSTYGTGLKNAALMALEDASNPNITLQFYDTQSTPAGAAGAVRTAINDGSKLILGPLTRDEVSAISHITKSANIPVISYTASQSVLSQGIYTLGLLSNEQIDRIIGYAAEKERRRIALMLPDNESGMNMAQAAVNSATRHNAEIVKIGFYAPDTMDFSEIVKALTDYDVRSENMEKHKQELGKRAQNGDVNADKELKKLKATYTEGNVDFDAILIPETGNRLKSAAAMFGYYDVGYPDVLFLGTSVWENTNLSKETTLYHGVYPSISRVYNNYFSKKYQDYFGDKPNQLYSFAYDSVLLSSALARKNSDNLEKEIINDEGYIGINGVFRIFPDGSNQHSLEVLEVTPDGTRSVSAAPKRFPPANDTRINYNMSMPEIYGKDPALVQNRLYQNRTNYFEGFVFREF